MSNTNSFKWIVSSQRNEMNGERASVYRFRMETKANKQTAGVQFRNFISTSLSNLNAFSIGCRTVCFDRFAVDQCWLTIAPFVVVCFVRVIYPNFNNSIRRKTGQNRRVFPKPLLPCPPTSFHPFCLLSVPSSEHFLFVLSVDMCVCFFLAFLLSFCAFVSFLLSFFLSIFVRHVWL